MKEAIGFYVVGCTAFYTSMEKTLDPYFPDYSITDSGILFSLKYGKRREIKRQVQNGYYFVTIISQKGKKKTVQIHRLVLLAFKGEPSKEKPICRHLDGNPLNNHITNLEWGSYQENSDDTLKHGRRKRGEKIWFSSLKEEQIKDIFKKYVAGQSAKSIAREFHVNASNIAMILKRKAWKHIHIDDDLISRANQKLKSTFLNQQQDKISEKDAEEILNSIIRDGFIDFEKIKVKYNLSKTAIYKIVKGQTKKSIYEKFNTDFIKLNRVIKNENVLSIFLDYQKGLSLRKMANKFKCDRKTIKKVLLRQSFNELDIPNDLVEFARRILSSGGHKR